MGLSLVRKLGFSLVELVIVVMIIGIIAAIAVPRISQAANTAPEKALRGNLRTLRTVIDLYAAEHVGAYPGYHKIDGKQKGDGDEEDFYAQLLECSTETGVTGSCTPPRVFGPYLREIPRLNVGKNAEEKADEVKFKTEVPLQEHEGDHTGWIYNPENGEIIANTKDVDSQGIPFTEY